MRLNLWELSQIRNLQLNFENCGNYYKIQKISFNQIFVQNHYFIAIIKI